MIECICQGFSVYKSMTNFHMHRHFKTLIFLYIFSPVFGSGENNHSGMRTKSWTK